MATEATVADGGDIRVLAQDTLRLQDSRITTAVRSGKGRGGNIFIDPEFVILERSQIVADAFGGPGGNIRVVAKGFITDAYSRVSASSAQAVNGLIDIRAVTIPTGLVTPLPQAFARAAELLHNRCAERLRGGTASRLMLGGRDGAPLEPGKWLPSPLEHVARQGTVRNEQRQDERRSSTVSVWNSAPSGQVQGHEHSARAAEPGVLHLDCAHWMRQQRATVHSTR